MARKTPATVTTAANAEDNVLRFDDAPEFNVGYEEEAPMEDMDTQVREAQHRLAALRAQQEEVERQKLILENLRQKQDRFVSGKKEITEKLDRGLRSISDDLEEARRRVEDLAITQQDFQERLDALKTFLPERWQRSQLDHELDRALCSLDEAETSYEKGVRRLMAHRQSETVQHSNAHPQTVAEAEQEEVAEAGAAMFATTKDDLMTWVRRGFAFNAALIATLIIVLILARLMF
jgi:DNA repair exonuclease SbcCD ATPase subunit